MRVKKLQLLIDPNLKVKINDPEDTASWEGACYKIPHKYLNRKVFALNPSHVPLEYRKEYEDCLDVWIEAEGECNGSSS